MFRRCKFMPFSLFILILLFFVGSCSLAEVVSYGEDCPGLEKIALGTGEVCSIDDKGDKFKGDCQNYLTFFKEERCPFDLPKCESRVCRSFGCSGGQLACNDECIDPQRDIRYCGAQTDCLGDNAGTKCASGQVCNQGKCQITCVDSQIVCAGKCVDPQNDVVYCGAKSDCLGDNSGTKCASGQVCSEGTCGVSCVVGQVICDNKCVDPSNDGRYCGADEDCADAKECASGEVCSQGVCAVSCVDGQIVCGNKCVDPQTDNAYCGALGNCLQENAGVGCKNGYVCSNGRCSEACTGDDLLCDGKCIVPSTNPLYCGAFGDCQGDKAGERCLSDSVCQDGNCVACPIGQINCGNLCIDPLDSVRYCGASVSCSQNPGVNCELHVQNANSVSCAGGTCSYQSCKPGYGDCDGNRANGCETALNTNEHCGSCSNNCSTLPHVNAVTCSSGKCGITTCQTNYVDCNGNTADGCEINVQSSTTNCGNCGYDCLALQDVSDASCHSGKCVITCNGAYMNCSGNVNSGCETDIDYNDRHCGRCDNICQNGTRCQAGECLR